MTCIIQIQSNKTGRSKYEIGQKRLTTSTYLYPPNIPFLIYQKKKNEISQKSEVLSQKQNYMHY